MGLEALYLINDDDGAVACTQCTWYCTMLYMCTLKSLETSRSASFHATMVRPMRVRILIRRKPSLCLVLIVRRIKGEVIKIRYSISKVQTLRRSTPGGGMWAKRHREQDSLLASPNERRFSNVLFDGARDVRAS